MGVMLINGVQYETMILVDPTTGNALGSSVNPYNTTGSGGGGGNASVSATGSAVPASATYMGVLSGSNLVGLQLGQQLSASSLPVVLTAAQITTLTPPTSVTSNQGTANATPWNENLAQVGGASYSLGRNTSANSLTVALASDEGVHQAAVSPGTTTPPSATMVVAGKTADGTPAYAVIPLAAGGLSVAVSQPFTGVTWQKGQGTIATTGTQVQLSSTSYVLQNFLIITSNANNNANGLSVGATGVNNTVSGTGNGDIILPGKQHIIPPGINLNTIYLNGTIGDIWYFGGN